MTQEVLFLFFIRIPESLLGIKKQYFAEQQSIINYAVFYS